MPFYAHRALPQRHRCATRASLPKLPACEPLECRRLLTASATAEFRFSADNYFAPEAGEIAWRLVRSGDVSDSAQVWFRTTAGTATADDVPGAGLTRPTPFLFGPGERVILVHSVLNNDSVPESDETAHFTLTSEDGTVLDTALVTIYDDDAGQPARVRFAADRFAIEERWDSTHDLDLIRTGAADSHRSVDLTLGAAGDTADSTDHAGLLNNDAHFFPGVVENRFARVLVHNDGVIEPDETLTISLSNASAGESESAVIDLLDSGGPVPEVSVQDLRLLEGGPGQTGYATVTFTLEHPAAHDVYASFALVDSTAYTSVDYASTGMTEVRIPAGETSATADVAFIFDDAEIEPDEQFLVRILESHAIRIGDGEAVVTIIDDDTPPQVSIDDAELVEGSRPRQSSTGTPAVFNVRLSRPLPYPVSVSATTVLDGSATSYDVMPAAGQIVFEPGETQKTFTAHVVADLERESDETFSVLLQWGDVAIADGSAVATIIDDDALPHVWIDDASFVELDGGWSQITLQLNLSRPLESVEAIDLAWATGHGSAGDDDYVPASGTARFERGGPLTQQIVLTVNGDMLDESDETFQVRLEAPPEVVNLGGATVRILEDDDRAPEIVWLYVGSTRWSQSFSHHLAASRPALGHSDHGFATSPSAPPDELPWTNIDRITVRFDENVVNAQNALTLKGLNRSSYQPASFSYFSGDATWTFSEPFGPERLQGILNGITDLEGNAMTTSAGTFRFDILPGDVNRSGGVLGNDVTLVRNAQGFSPGQGLYSVFKDVNGSGSILGNDVTAVRNRQGITLPPGTFSTSEPLSPPSTRAGELEPLWAR